MSDTLANGYVDEETLAEYAVDEFEARELQKEALRHSTAPFPTYGPGDGRSWREFFVDLRNDGSADAVPPVRRLVLCVDLTPSEEGLGSSPKKILKRVRDAGWPRVELHWSLVTVSDSFYADDSAKKPGEEAPAHRKGDLKKPGHVVQHWWMTAAHPAFRLAFRAHWIEGLTPKGGRSFGFQKVLAADPIGMPAELFTDYSPDATDKKQVKDEPGHIYEGRLALMEAAARRRDREYNDGKSWLNRRPMFSSFGEFDTWLTEAIDMTTPKPATPPA